LKIYPILSIVKKRRMILNIYVVLVVFVTEIWTFYDVVESDDEVEEGNVVASLEEISNVVEVDLYVVVVD